MAREGKTVGTNVLLKMDKLGQSSSDLVHEYDTQVSGNKYLIVIDGLSKIDEWHSIKSYFPDNKNGSRVVVATQQVEIASLCPEQPCQASKLEQFSSNQVLYLFHRKIEMDSPEPISNSASATTTGPSSSSVTPSEIQEENVQQLNGAGGENVLSSTSTVERNFYRSKTRPINPEDIVVGRTTEKQTIIDLVGRPEHCHGYKVISVWGMGGIGKTTLVRSVYRSQQLSGWKHAWVTVLRPFNRDTLLRNLALQLQDITSDGKKKIITMETTKLIAELSIILQNHNCLVVLDDLSSIEEWNSMETIVAKSKRIIATTREKFVAKYCSKDDQNMYSLRGLEEAAALDLFKRKVFKDASNLDLDSGMFDLAKLILKKCDGLPLAITTIGGYLANRPQNAMEWRKLNISLSAEIEINLELKMINTALMRSYDGLPYHLKACFLYLAIFSEDDIIRRSHIVKRWMAESFTQDMHHMTAVQVGNKYFDELIDRSMTLTLEQGSDGEIDSCQLHDLIREICVSKAREENLVLTLEEGTSLDKMHGAIRHLVISRNWNRDKDAIQKVLDLSHIRSLTVFGEWRSFFISNKMRFVRVLDLEHTVGLRDHHLDQIMELLHLRYLSLRGCVNIFKLPDSTANLRQLQTLDVRNTYLCKLPITITSLQKLQYLRTSGFIGEQERDIIHMYKGLIDGGHVVTRDYGETTDVMVPKLPQCFDRRPKLERYLKRSTRNAKGLQNMCHVFWRPRWLEDPLGKRTTDVVEGVTKHDICNMCCYLIKHKEDTCMSYGVVWVWGVEVPIGISKMKGLHTLCDVSVARGKVTFQELRELTQLRNLGVTDVTEENDEKFWRSIAGHSQLQSLSVKTSFGRGRAIDECLSETLCPPKCLEILKIDGQVMKLTEWIHRLQNLSKLHLQHTCLYQEQDGIGAIGMLPNLAILRLKPYSYVGVQLRFQRWSFRNLSVLELYYLCQTIKSLEFEPEAMSKLELLQIYKCWFLEEISGLQFLINLKEIWVDNNLNKEQVQRKLAEYPNQITLKLL
ncbi:hypothetical protein PR202_ga25162 [Eleusine coracana subsp. coracana]|uniref:NB-ARC domain-containing protein n=1 Tax=Eleusine coracana subsp. coracana TaxID=191504 RepID=A0AAV5DA87_ELECO|nr:hypothetical protein PR202_ga25162 [Eleusine coracana subsp. coracana]